MGENEHIRHKNPLEFKYLQFGFCKQVNKYSNCVIS